MPRFCQVCKKKQALYGFSDKQPIYCSSCRPPEATIPNVRATRCPCGKFPSFNFKGLKPLYCKKCKPDATMISVRAARCSCGKIAIYNFKGLPVRFCTSCKTDDMINSRKPKKKCIGVDESKICPFNFVSQRQGYWKKRCSRCFQQAFPLEAAKRQMRLRTKEMEVKVFLANEFSEFIHDKPLWTDHCDCTTRRRIDFRKTIGSTMLAVECDEFQHQSYDEKDKDVRVNDLYMGFSGKFIYIRFNPDVYKNNKNQKCNPKLQSRLPRLKEEIDRQIERIQNEENKELVEEIYLYYDGFNQ